MTAAPPATCLHEIETPDGPVQARDGRFKLSGWCLDARNPRPPRVRLRLDRTHFVAGPPIRREDVARTFGAPASAADCGFSIEGRAAAGFHLGCLEASFDDIDWLHLRTLTLFAPESPLAVSIEWPATPVVHDSLRIQGWCAHPDYALAGVWLHYGNKQIPCEYGLPRTDVPGLLPGSPDAARAGFISVKNIPVGHGPLRIRAVTTCGRTFFAHPPITIDIATDEENPAPLDLHSPLVTLGPARIADHAAPPAIATRPLRILFVLYGDLTSNSALHVASLANELAARGHDCLVAVPHHPETIRYHQPARFRCVSFDNYDGLSKIVGAPDIVHAWTTRENVRQFCEHIGAAARSRLVIHLEDHELRILEANLSRPLKELLTLTDTELDVLVPASLSHPRRSRTFLETAQGVTVILDRLRELVPAGRPVQVVPPAADATAYFERPVPWELREALGWGRDHTVLFYHGNMHATNRTEMGELYAAVLLLNQSGIPTTLIRTGRNFCDLPGDLATKSAPHVIVLGQIDRHHHLPPLMALADIFVQPGAPDRFNDYRFPSKLPEFFAIGRPVILPRTNLGELVRHGEDAWVLPNANAAAIAEAVRTIRADPTLATRLATGAAAFARTHFSWSRSAESLQAFYNTLLPEA